MRTDKLTKKKRRQQSATATSPRPTAPTAPAHETVTQQQAPTQWHHDDSNKQVTDNKIKTTTINPDETVTFFLFYERTYCTRYESILKMTTRIASKTIARNNCCAAADYRRTN
jgi:hypothetical protein